MKIFIISLILISFTFSAYSQDELSAKLSEARTQYTSGNLEDARFALEQALVEVDNIIGKLILDQLPTSLNEFKVNSEEDSHVGSTAGFAGVYVLRKYEDPNHSGDSDKYIEFSLVNDSPFMGMVNAFVSNPLAGAVPGQKRLKIDGYKAMLQKPDNDENSEYSVLLPFNQSLISIKFMGVSSESDVIGMTNQFPVKEIINIAQ